MPEAPSPSLAGNVTTRESPISSPLRDGNLDDYPSNYYAVRVIALSSAEGLDAFVEANSLQDMLRLTRTDVDTARFLLLEGIYPSLTAAKTAAERLSDDGRFGTPYVRPLASLQPRENGR